MVKLGTEKNSTIVRVARLLVLIVAFPFLVSCDSPPNDPPPEVKITIWPKEVTLFVGSTQQFAAVVTGTNDRTVDWYVNDVLSGDLTVGTIDTSGLYTAPDAVPNPPGVTVKAVSRADSTKWATATVTITGPTDQPLLLWITYFPAPAGDRGHLWDVLIDKDENVIAAGTAYAPSGASLRAIVLSTDRAGRQRWIYASDGPAQARSIVLAPDLKSVFVVGILGDYPEALPLLFAVDSAGNKLLEQVCSDMVGGGFLYATKDDSRIYLTAYTPGPAIVTSDLAGNLDCAYPIDAAIGDLPRPKIGTVSPFDGALVVAGNKSMSNECWKAGFYPFVQKVDGSTQPVWRFDFESTIAPAGTISTPILAVANEAGQEVIYLAAARHGGCPTVTVNDNARYMTAKLDAQGNLIWLNLWNGDNSPVSCETYPFAIVADPRGGVVIAGYQTATNCDPYHCGVASYAADGSVRWTMKPTFKGNETFCTAATMTSDGRFLYLAGRTGPYLGTPKDLFIAKYALPQ